MSSFRRLREPSGSVYRQPSGAPSHRCSRAGQVQRFSVLGTLRTAQSLNRLHHAISYELAARDRLGVAVFLTWPRRPCCEGIEGYSPIETLDLLIAHRVRCAESPRAIDGFRERIPQGRGSDRSSTHDCRSTDPPIHRSGGHGIPDDLGHPGQGHSRAAGGTSCPHGGEQVIGELRVRALSLLIWW